MFGPIGTGEIILIAVIALIIIGPEKFPEVAKVALRVIRDMRQYVKTIQTEVASELNPLKSDMSELTKFGAEDLLEKISSTIESDISIGDEGKASLEEVTSVTKQTVQTFDEIKDYVEDKPSQSEPVQAPSTSEPASTVDPYETASTSPADTNQPTKEKEEDYYHD